LYAYQSYCPALLLAGTDVGRNLHAVCNGNTAGFEAAGFNVPAMQAICEIQCGEDYDCPGDSTQEYSALITDMFVAQILNLCKPTDCTCWANLCSGFNPSRMRSFTLDASKVLIAVCSRGGTAAGGDNSGGVATSKQVNAIISTASTLFAYETFLGFTRADIAYMCENVDRDPFAGALTASGLIPAAMKDAYCYDVGALCPIAENAELYQYALQATSTGILVAELLAASNLDSFYLTLCATLDQESMMKVNVDYDIVKCSVCARNFCTWDGTACHCL